MGGEGEVEETAGGCGREQQEGVVGGEHAGLEEAGHQLDLGAGQRHQAWSSQICKGFRTSRSKVLNYLGALKNFQISKQSLMLENWCDID